MADGWSAPDVGQHDAVESCDLCWRRPELGDGLTSPDYVLMPRSFCPFVSGERRG